MSELKLTELEMIKNTGEYESAQDLYDLLDRVGFEYEVVEIFDGVRVLAIQVAENEESEDE